MLSVAAKKLKANEVVSYKKKGEPSICRAINYGGSNAHICFLFF